MKKSTHIDLVAELERRDVIRYASLIENAKNLHYHDFKSPKDIVGGKVKLVNDLKDFPELMDIAIEIMEGEYRDEPDDADKAELKEALDKKYPPITPSQLMGLD